MTQRERDALAARVREDAEWAASAERAAEEAEYVRITVLRGQPEEAGTVEYTPFHIGTFIIPDDTAAVRLYFDNTHREDTVPPRTFANVRAAGQAWRWVVGSFLLVWALAVLYAVVTR